jgi:DNA-binding transcriptional LysR family regulator
MELRHLRYFVAAAEEEHFGRAAHRLNLTEPALSLQIKELERELNVQLFERLPRGVRLTAAGAVFLADTRRTLKLITEAAEHARRVERGEVGRLRVGRIPDTPLRVTVGELVGRLIATFCVRYPKVDVDVVHGNSSEQWAALRDRRVDVATVFSPPEDPTGLVGEALAEFGLAGALLPASHPLARKQTLLCRDLRALPLLQYPRSAHPLQYDTILRGLRERGLELQRTDVHPMTDLTVGVGMVAAGAGWLPFSTAAGESLAAGPGLVYREWADPPIPFSVYLLWREAESSPVVARLLAIARELRAAAAKRPARYVDMAAAALAAAMAGLGIGVGDRIIALLA